VRSNYPADIRKGLILLEQLIKHEANDDDAKRNYLYYLALGNSRIKVSTEHDTLCVMDFKKKNIVKNLYYNMFLYLLKILLLF